MENPQLEEAIQEAIRQIQSVKNKQLNLSDKEKGYIYKKYPAEHQSLTKSAVSL